MDFRQCTEKKDALFCAAARYMADNHGWDAGDARKIWCFGPDIASAFAKWLFPTVALCQMTTISAYGEGYAIRPFNEAEGSQRGGGHHLLLTHSPIYRQHYAPLNLKVLDGPSKLG